MQDINYPDEFPGTWDSAGGEGDEELESQHHDRDKRWSKGYYVHWFASDEFDCTVDSPLRANEHIVTFNERTQDGETGYPIYSETFEVKGDALVNYLTAKQKAWDHAVEIMRKIEKYGQSYEPENEETKEVSL